MAQFGIHELRYDYQAAAEAYNQSQLSDEQVKQAFYIQRWKQIINHPCVVLITGKRGSGKSALGYWLLELFSDTLPSYVLGLPKPKWNLLPELITPLDLKELHDLPTECLIFIDEAALWFYARKFMNSLNLLMDKLVSISRQRDQSLILAAHHTRKLDINLVTDLDLLIFKQPSVFHSKFDRVELRKITAQVFGIFSKLPPNEIQQWSVVYSSELEAEKMWNPLPSFWSEDLSKAFGALVLEPSPQMELSSPESKLQELLSDLEYRQILIQIVEYETTHEYPWTWDAVGVHPAKLGKLITHGILTVVGRKKGRSYYKLRAEIREQMEKWRR